MLDIVISFEVELLNNATRRNIDRLDQLIADNFMEFGASGSIYKKSDILDRLPIETPRTFEPFDISARYIDNQCILVTYRLFEGERNSLRSSIWSYREGKWHMIFHQGTPFTV